MIDDIALHREELRELCRRFHVQRLDLVGSATRDDFDPKESLETLFGRSVDLVEESAVVNPYLKAEFERSRVPLFEA
jgi:predicted nucleotidyltransferase